MAIYTIKKPPSRGARIAAIVAQALGGYVQGRQIKEQREREQRQAAQEQANFERRMRIEEELARWQMQFPQGFTEAELEAYGLTEEEVAERNRRRERMRQQQEERYYEEYSTAPPGVEPETPPLNLEAALTGAQEWLGKPEGTSGARGPMGGALRTTAGPRLSHPPLTAGPPGWWPDTKLGARAIGASPRAVLGEAAKDLANARNIYSKAQSWMRGTPEQTARPGDSVIDGVVISSNARPVKVGALRGDDSGKPVMGTDNRGEYILTERGMRIYVGHLVATDNKVYVYMGDNRFVQVKQERTNWVKAE